MLEIFVVLLAYLVLHHYVEFDEFYFYAGLVALLGHVVVTLVVLPIVPFGWDIGNFHNAAIELFAGGFPTASTTVTAFGTVQGILYTIFGIDTTVVSIVNGLLAVLVPIPAVYLAKQLYGEQLRSTDGLVALILFLPLPFLFLSLPMRDALSVLFVFSSLALVVRTLRTRDRLLGLPTLALIAATYFLRPEWGLVLLLGFFAGSGMSLYEHFEIKQSISRLIALGGLLGTIAFLLFAEVMYSFERVNAELSFRASGGAVYLEGMQYQSWFDVLLAAPGRAIYFQFAPFPLHVETLFHLLAFISTLYVIVFFVAAARSLYEYETDDVVLAVLLVTYLAGIVGYGLINSNFGTNVRHRIPFVFLLIVFAAPVIQRWELAVRQWLGVGPDENKQQNGQQCETEKLDSHV